MPIGKAVLTMSVPMIISQTITIIYNVADTFFVGQMNEPNQVAAVTLAMPLFYLLTALTNLFGVDGASMVSHYLGEGKRELARRCAVFCIWTCVGISFVYGIVLFFVRPILLPVIGANADYKGHECEAFMPFVSILELIINKRNLPVAKGNPKQQQGDYHRQIPQQPHPGAALRPAFNPRDSSR